jgi:hypothetical protein
MHRKADKIPKVVFIPENGITMFAMTHEPIIETLRRNLRSVPPAEWERIAAECGVARTLPRKIAYGDRMNPGVMTVQPLINWFAEQKTATALTAQHLCATESAA